MQSQQSKKQHFPWIVQAAGTTDIGKVRTNNEDSWLIDLDRRLFIVSDGMGGHQAGEVASKAVVTVLPAMIEQLAAQKKPASESAYKLVLRDAILSLSRRLHEESQGQAGLQGMGATLVLVWIIEGRRTIKAFFASMGDSRIYRLRNKAIQQLTRDHSLVALLVRHGEITEEEAKGHPARGRLSRYVGMEGDTFADVFSLDVLPGDRFLLCSDGLSGMVPDAKVAQLLVHNPEPELACKALMTAANEAGGKDNITALVINVDVRKGAPLPQRPLEHNQQRTPGQERVTERPQMLDQQKKTRQFHAPDSAE